QLARAQLAYLLAAGHAQRAARCADETTREAAWHQAMSWNSLAASSKSPGDAPQSVVRQRARFLKARGDEQGAAEWLALTREGQANAPAFDAYLQAVDWAAEGESERAIERLRQIVADAPRDWNAWFSLGNLLADAERWDESAECYTMCVAIRPDVGWPYLQRGICRLSQKEFARAEADFTSALAIGNSLDAPSSRIGTGEPTESLLVAHWNRALARRGRNDLPGAIDDVSAALRLAPNEPRLWLLRAEYRTAAGELDDATSDRKAGLRLTPNDDIGWVVRGVARLSENDPTGARRDFEQALAINPNNIAALQNLAHVMSEYSGEIDQALATLDRLVAIAPTEPHFVASRGVLLARAGRISEALQEADDVNATVRSISDRPRAGMATYQLACIHALAAKAYESNQTPLETEGAEQRTLVERRIAQRQQDALKLLAQAITFDPQLRKLAYSDPDLASLRELPAWSQTLESLSTPANP
ncbi:MAG: tetratricopeptide repeat protein, partial [Planctomycetales bacterium]|nr:tetratricopeptide repeat protein [Planctomycetales bacterium]